MDYISAFLSSLLAQDPTQGFAPLQWALAAGLAYLGGVLSSLTPCIYPMIPITVSVVGGMPGSSHPTWRGVLERSLAYVLGMTLIYAFLGVLAGLTGKVFGSFTNTPAWYLSLGAIMTAAALWMLDVITFDPAAWLHKLSRKAGRSKKSTSHHTQTEHTLWGAFGLGASSGFIAAPCTTPVLTAILAFIANTRSIGLGLTLMIAFSLGLGTLLIGVGAFAGALQALPRSGKWLQTIKVGSGLLLLAFAEYLIYLAGTKGGPS